MVNTPFVKSILVEHLAGWNPLPSYSAAKGSSYYSSFLVPVPKQYLPDVFDTYFIFCKHRHKIGHTLCHMWPRTITNRINKNSIGIGWSVLSNMMKKSATNLLLIDLSKPHLHNTLPHTLNVISVLPLWTTQNLVRIRDIGEDLTCDSTQHYSAQDPAISEYLQKLICP